jgi:prolyl-tRNA synthetase
MAMPVIRGVKSRAEKFAGADRSYCIEAMMQNGFALQAGTSHDLGQNFGRAFDVKFQNKDKELEHVWQTSWGVSTRLIGGLVMTHSDDAGLVLPPKLAPVHVAIVPIYRSDDQRTSVIGKAQELAAALRDKQLVVELDDRDYKPGFKFFHWEQRGVPVRIELGPRDVAASQAVIKRRTAAAKETLPLAGLVERLVQIMDEMQRELLEAARQRTKDNTVVANSYEEVAEILEPVTAERGGGKFVMVHLADDPAVDAKIKELKASVRCIPLVDAYDGPGKCVITGQDVDRRVVVAKAY